MNSTNRWLLCRIGVAVALLVSTFVICTAGPRPQLDSRTGVVLRVPEHYLATLFQAGPVERYLSEEEKEWLPIDTEVVRNSFQPTLDETRRRTGTALLRVGVVLSGADDRSLHRPEVCMPGQGWKIVNNGGENRNVDLEELGSLEVRVLRMEQKVEIRGEEHTIHAQYWYWWEGTHDFTPSTIKRTVLQMKSSLLTNRTTRWAYPSVFGQMALDPDIPVDEKRRRMEQTMTEALMEWAPMALRRFGANDLNSLEQEKAQREQVEPVDEVPKSQEEQRKSVDNQPGLSA